MLRMDFFEESRPDTTFISGVNALASAIVYADGFQDTHINVVEECGIFFLEGRARNAGLIEQATAIAVKVVGHHVCNRIELCS